MMQKYLSMLTDFCPELPAFLNGAISYSEPSVNDGNFGPGTIATYSCLTSFTLFGSSTRECGEDRQWSGVEPSCDCECPNLCMQKCHGINMAIVFSSRLNLYRLSYMHF